MINCLNFFWGPICSRQDTYIWHVRPYAGVLIAVVCLLWLWTWGVVKGIGRVVIAALISEWYFYRQDLHPIVPDGLESQAVPRQERVAISMNMSTLGPTAGRGMAELTVAAIQRATGPSLGSICLSSLVVAVARFIGRLAVEARRVSVFSLVCFSQQTVC